MVCFTMYPEHTQQCRHMEMHAGIQSHVQRESTTYLILHKLLTNTPALVLGMFCGAWSDKYGRKLPMALPCFGTTFAVLFYMAANMAYEGSTNLFLCGSFVHGCFGKTAMINMAVNSYIVDVTTVEKRTKKLGILAAMQFLGMFVGSLLGGLLIDLTSVLTSYCIVSAISAVVVTMTLLCLRETIKVDDDENLSPCKSFFQGSNVQDSFKVLTKNRSGNIRTSIFSLFLIVILHQTCRTGLTDVTLLYTEKSPLSWPTSWFGYLSAAENAAMGIILLVLLPVFSSVAKLNDATISMIGLFCACVRFVIMTWSKKTWMVWLSMVIGSVGGVINSPVRSLLSKMVHEDEVGKMFSLLGSGETVAKFCAVFFTYLYGHSLDIFPGLPFILAAVLYIFMIIIMLIVHINSRKSTDETPTLPQEQSNLELSRINYTAAENTPCKNRD
ncbi:proton-coupled folate transporter-like [Saccostrea echinata]|uniref:proton-coupled folate transporter-like n=1 Tax=Saccostrea echinata TaxID=191078 RepID=UPI002A7FCE7E|nr:proton-coupled folate transporter-like [Saccostrea echinata]